MRDLLKKVVGVGALRIIGAAFVFALDVLVARHLGSEGAGLFFLSFSIISAVSVVARLGMDNVLLREFAGLWASGQRGLAKGVWLQALLLVGLSSIAVSAALIFMLPQLSVSIFQKPEIAGPVFWMLLGLPFYSLIVISSIAFQAFGKVKISVIAQSIALPLAVFLVVAVYGATSAEQVGRYWFVFATLIGLSLCVIFSWLTRAPVAQAANISGNIRSAFPMWIVQVLAVIQNFGMPLLLGVLVAASELAWFYAANRVSIIVALVLMAMNVVVAPKIAEHYKSGDREGLELLLRRTMLLMLWVATPILLIILCYPGWILSLFGDEFVKAATVLRILAFAQIINVATGPVGYVLMMTGHERHASHSAMLGSLLIVVGGFLLVPGYGMLGAAIAVALSKITTNLLNMYWVHRTLGINPVMLFLKRP